MSKTATEMTKFNRYPAPHRLLAWIGFHLISFVCLEMAAGSEIKTTFNGSQYIAYPIPSHEIGSTSDRIELSFKTAEPYGVLLYSGGTQGDFVALEIIRGKLSYSADLGSIADTSGYHQVIIGENVADNKWHKVVIIQNQKEVTVILDDQSKSIVAPGLFTRLDLDIFLYVGGINRVEQKKHGVWIPETKHFKGCLSNVKFRSRDILHSAKFKLLNTVTYGQVAFSCIPDTYDPMSFLSSNSKILLQRDKERNDTVLSLTLRTLEANGIVATMSTTNGHVTLIIISGKAYLSMAFDHHIGPEKKVTISAGKLDDGDWHDVGIVIDTKTNSMSLKIDDETRTFSFHTHFILLNELGPFTKIIRLGGPSIRHPGFVGCLRHIRLDEKNIGWKTLQSSQISGISKSCIPKDLCFPNPCRNSGNCSQDHGLFSCACQKSKFKGQLCEHSVYKRTCDEIYKAGQRASGTYRISPNGVDSFDIYCKMDHKLGPATIVRHTLPPNARVADKIPSGSRYIYKVQYTISKISAAEVADASTSCRQFIRYDCYESKLLDSLRRYSNEHTRGGRWVSRDGIIQTYWGGASPGSKVCGCGMPNKRNCADRHLDCNCDIGDLEWRNDKGFLTDKSALPVTMMQFSVDQQKGRTQRSTFTVGHMECFGTAPLPTTTSTPTTQSTTHSTIQSTTQPNTIGTKSSGHVLYKPTVFAPKAQPTRNNVPDTIYTTIHNTTWNSTYDATSISNQDDLFPKPYLVTIVVIGTILCFLLIALVGILFKAKVSGLLFRKSCPPRPHVEIEEYDPRSSVISSDWEFRVGNAFPTSTPDESTTTSEEDMRVRTLEDVRGRRKYGRLGTWGSRTASAPTLGGRMRSSRISITDRRCASRHSGILNNDRSNLNDRDDASSQPYETSSDSSKYTMKSTTNTSNSNSSRFSTCTEQGTASDSESVKDASARNGRDDTSISKRSSKSEKDFDMSRGDNPALVANGHMPDVKYAPATSVLNRLDDTRYNGNGFHGDNFIRINGLSVPFNNQDIGKQYFPPANQTNYTHRPHIRRIPQLVPHPEYGTHLQLMNATGRNYYPSQIGRFMTVGKRPFTTDGIPFVQQTIQEVDVPEEEQDVETNLIEDRVPLRKNSNTVIANGSYRHDAGSEYSQDSQEGLALLRRQIIEKATNLDDGNQP